MPDDQSQPITASEPKAKENFSPILIAIVSAVVSVIVGSLSAYVTIKTQHEAAGTQLEVATGQTQSQMRMQEEQAKAQIEIQKMQLQGQLNTQHLQTQGQIDLQKQQAKDQFDIERLKATESMEIEQKRQLATANLAKQEFETKLIMQAVQDVPREVATKNLLFFLEAGFITDNDGKLQKLAYIAPPSTTNPGQIAPPTGLAGSVIQNSSDPTLAKNCPPSDHWVYRQRDGMLCYEGSQIGFGYSGNGLSLNNPLAQAYPDGPIPQGIYVIGAAEDKPGAFGPISMSLIPDSGTTSFNRAGFLIHGDNSAGNRSASNGSVILGREIRQQIAKSPDRKLVVIP